MKVASTNQVVVLTIPQPDLLLLLVMPEFKALLARFPSLIKAQFAAEPCKLFIRRTVVPFILETRSQFVVMARLRESLKALPSSSGKMR